MQPNLRELLLGYLLDAMPLEEREAFELRLIEDELFSEAIEEEEFDLIDEYAAGTLPSNVRKEIKSWIKSSPELRTRVLIVQRLHSIKPTRKPWRWWLLGTTTVTACFLLLAIARTKTHSVPSSTPSASAVNLTTKNQQDTILLAAVRQRGNASADTPVVYTVHRTNATRLQILLPPSAQSAAYTVQLQNEQPITEVKPQGPIDSPYLELIFPAGTLHQGHHRIALNSSSERYEIAFRIVAK